MSAALPLETLLAPIPGSSPGGEDLTYAAELDAIREARRSDDPSLAQGDWETQIKTANWGRVRSLCETLLHTRSKDFQVACWYAEAAARIDGFAGLDRGLQVVLSLLTDYWEFAFPVLDAADLDERCGRIEWLNAQLPLVIRNIALTAPAAGQYSWLQWQESRAVANLGLKDAEAMAAALADGKLAAEVFDRAVTKSGVAFYSTLTRDLLALEVTLGRLMQASDGAFGETAPALTDLRDAIRDCSELAQRLLKSVGGAPAAAPGATPDAVVPPALAPAAPASAPLAGSRPPAGGAATTDAPWLTRAEAIAQLRAVARFFREHEPHSPVAPLVERAARWAEMPFEQWLASVIKDESTLGQLHDLLDLRATPGPS